MTEKEQIKSLSILPLIMNLVDIGQENLFRVTMYTLHVTVIAH